MRRPRDTGKKAVYAAEAEVFGKCTLRRRVSSCLCQHLTLDEIRDLADEIVPGIVVKDGRGRRRAGGNAQSIKMPIWTRCMHQTLHELAHSIVERYPGDYRAWHGAAWRAEYLRLLSEYLPEWYPMLRDAFQRAKLI